MTAEEWFEGMRHAWPSTDDGVTVLWDGRRLDSRAAVMEWLAEVEVKRADGLGVGADAGARTSKTSWLGRGTWLVSL